jgi:2-methylisocitrate lyase-like PEP mutase family enzyme
MPTDLLQAFSPTDKVTLIVRKSKPRPTKTDPRSVAFPKKSQPEKAETFRSLHHAEHILVLPNAWDVPSARLFEDAGFPALATSSAGLSVSLGYPDGEKISKDELFSAVGRIASALTVPLSADIEAGFGSTIGQLTKTIRGVIHAGAVGINIEDIAEF